MLDQLSKNIFKRSLGFTLIILGLMVFIFEDYMLYIRGYAFGLLVSMLTFLLIVDSTGKMMTMDVGRAQSYAKRQYMIRMSIYFIVLLISAKAEYLDFLSTFLGLIMIKLVIVLSTILKWEL